MNFKLIRLSSPPVVRHLKMGGDKRQFLASESFAFSVPCDMVRAKVGCKEAVSNARY